MVVRLKVKVLQIFQAILKSTVTPDPQILVIQASFMSTISFPSTTFASVLAQLFHDQMLY